MEVRYTTTVDDLVAYFVFMYRRSAVVRPVEMIGWLIVPALILIVAIWVAYADGFSVDGTIYVSALAATGIAISLAIYPFVQRWVNVKWLRWYAEGFGTRGIIGLITLILNEDTLIEVTETTRTETKWRDMDSVHEIGDYTFIMVTGMTSAILPRHGFACDEEYFKVRDFAKARVGRRE